MKQDLSGDDLKTMLMVKIRDDLEKIEESLRLNVNANLELVRKIAGHILFAGGKRLRPLLMINCAKMCGYQGKQGERKALVDFSIIFEYLHAATLLHDDVIDEAVARRGRKTAHHIWSAPEVILTGDFLLARSLSITADTRNPDIISTIATITEEMSQGEIDQLMYKGRLDLSREHYFSIIRRKTAVLIEGACRCGALLAGAAKTLEDALFNYGHNLGMAFQMADDLLDYTSDAQTLGKKPGADLREGKLTLPLIKTLERASQEDRILIEKIVMAKEFSQTGFGDLVALIRKYKGIEYTEAKALEYVENAKRCLDMFQASDQKELLTMLADYSVKREV